MNDIAQPDVAVVVDPYRRTRMRWAIIPPLAVLAIALLLIPVRRPAELSDNEASRLATVQAIVEQHTLAIDKSLPELQRPLDRIREVRLAGAPMVAASYSKQPPAYATLLAGPYWVMHRFGWDFARHPLLVIYLLTILGVTIPVAAAAGLVYRMGRLFELRRPWRVGLAIVTVCASGLISYSTALNSNAPAAALVLGACACFFHVAIAARPSRTWAWLGVAGFCASLAAVIDLAAVVFLVLLITVIFAMRWPAITKAGGVIMYLVGAISPLLLYAGLTVPITGDLKPGFLHAELFIDAMAMPKVTSDDGEDVSVLRVKSEQTVDALVGAHGLFSHFPAVLLGIFGVGIVLRRHWPIATKTLATITLVAGVGIIAGYLILNPDWHQPMFSVRWFVIFLPLTLFWGGAWLRNSHHKITWIIASVVIGFSVLTSLVGATNPFVASRGGEYTAYSAVRKLWNHSGNGQADAGAVERVARGE